MRDTSISFKVGSEIGCPDVGKDANGSSCATLDCALDCMLLTSFSGSSSAESHLGFDLVGLWVDGVELPDCKESPAEIIVSVCCRCSARAADGSSGSASAVMTQPPFC